MSAAPSGRFSTRSAIEDYGTSDFAAAAVRWRTAATESDEVFAQHRLNVVAPGGTTWEGGAKDAALDRVTADGVVAGEQNGVVREAAAIAENAVADINAALREAVEAIIAAEKDGFRVGEDLSVTDTRRYDIATMVARNRAAEEHAEAIRWYALRLGQAVAFVEGRLQNKAAELEAIRFEHEDDGRERDGEATVQLVDNEVHDKPAEDRRDEPGGTPAEQATGQIGPFGVPQAVEDAAKNPEDRPADKPSTTSDVGGDLGDLLGVNDTEQGNPQDGRAELGDQQPGGLPPALGQVPPPPDKAAIDRQAAKVEAARRALAAAQTKVDDAAVQDYVHGAGAGPGRGVSEPLAQAVFDARAQLTEQQRILNELNYASAAAGGPTAPVAPLPQNADVHAYPPQPPVIEQTVDAFAAGTKDMAETVWDATMPDLGNMHHVASDWDGATPAERTQAAIDAAGMVPIPPVKILGEGIEHGLDALGGASRHLDDAPTPHVDPSPGPHTDMGGGHVDPPTVDASAPPQHSITPDTFEPYQGLHYTSGDPHHPGGWPPGTPEATWSQGDTDPGWHHVNRGDDRPWMPYQEQISGAERLPDGRIPEYAQTNPDTGKPVNFDGHTYRADQEVFLDAKDGYAKLATEPGKPWTNGMADGLLDEVDSQLQALPDKAILEIHVSDPAGAAAVRRLIEANDLFGATVIYTPTAP